MAKTKRSDPPLSAAVPQETAAAAESTMVGFTEDFLRTSEQALQRAQDFLGVPIDLTQLADPEWLASAENRRAAMVLLKLAGIQAGLAVSIISGTLKAGDRLPDPEKERTRAATLEQLRALLQTPSSSRGSGANLSGNK